MLPKPMCIDNPAALEGAANPRSEVRRQRGLPDTEQLSPSGNADTVQAHSI